MPEKAEHTSAGGADPSAVPTLPLRSRGSAWLALLPYTLLFVFVAQELRALDTADALTPAWSRARLGVPLLVLACCLTRVRCLRVVAALLFAFLSFELFADRATLAYFGRVFGLDLLALAGQLGDVQESAASLVGWLDLGLLALAWSAALTLACTAAPSRGARGSWFALALGALLLWPALREEPGEHVGLKDGEAEHAAHHGLPAAHLHDMLASLQAWCFPPSWSPALAAEARALLARTQALNAEPSPLFGIAEGRSVLFVQLEAFQQFVLDVQLPGGALTPRLSALASAGLRFDRCFDATRLGRTSDAELMVLTGLPAHSRRSTAFHLEARASWPSIASDLAARGYSTHSLHAFEPRFWNRALAHPLYGIDTLHFRDQLASERPDDDPRLGWGLPDDVFFERVTQRLRAAPAPFFALALALSSHHPFRRLPDGPRFDTGLVPGSMADGYLRLVHFSDAALGVLAAELQAAGLWEQLVIVIYGDHDAGLDTSARAAIRDTLGLDPGAPAQDRVPLVVLVPGREAELAVHAESLRPQPLMLYDLPATLRDLLGLPPDPEGLGVHAFVPAELRGVRALPRGRSFLAGAELHTLDDDLSALSSEQIEQLEVLGRAAAAQLRLSDALLELGSPPQASGDVLTEPDTQRLDAAPVQLAAQVTVGGSRPLPDEERVLALMPRHDAGLSVFLELHNGGSEPQAWSLRFHDTDGRDAAAPLTGRLAPGERRRLSLPGNARGETPVAHARLRASAQVNAQQWVRFRLLSARYPLVEQSAESWDLELPADGWSHALLFAVSASDSAQQVQVTIRQAGEIVRREQRRLPPRGAWQGLSVNPPGGAPLRVEFRGEALSAALLTQAASDDG
ncbi:MAG: hypothetical protein DHS20C15_05020 [Planctomycetota bacterium]|nr:MAG: hypothetical protein DHS20C15_05020 [Planctomycetota bacterium]